MSDTLSLKHQLEEFLYQEADYCDEWQFEEWLGLWADGEVVYEIGPLDTPHGENTSKDQILYLVSDNRFRLEQRVIRMQKTTAHAEWPIRSRLRHSYTNLRNISQDGNEVTFKVNLLVARTRTDTEGVSVIPGYALFKVEITNSGFRLREKRIFLDLNMLSRPGTMSVIL